MPTPIYKTENEAALAAKRQALQSFDFDVDQTTKDQWLVQNESYRCACGDTPSVHVVFFPDLSDMSIQIYGMAAYCECCGEDY